MALVPQQGRSSCHTMETAQQQQEEPVVGKFKVSIYYQYFNVSICTYTVTPKYLWTGLKTKTSNKNIIISEQQQIN